VTTFATSEPRAIVGAPNAFAAVLWAGYPIEDEDGVVLGTFCLMDSNPHEWTATDLHVLATLAMAASSEIALRRYRAELDVAHDR
jgi:GAF domain-containing protein